MIVISGALVVVAAVLLLLGFVTSNLTFIYAAIGLSVVSGLFLLFGILQPQPPQRAPRSGGNRGRRDEGREGAPRRKRKPPEGGEQRPTEGSQDDDESVTVRSGKAPNGDQSDQSGEGAKAGAVAGAAAVGAVAGHQQGQHQDHGDQAQQNQAQDGQGQQAQDPQPEHQQPEHQQSEHQQSEHQQSEQQQPEDPYFGHPDVEQVSPEVAAAAESSGSQVHVVSGHPRYHLEHCSVVVGDPELEPLDIAEAKELGFTPCAVCSPDGHLGGHQASSGSGGGAESAATASEPSLNGHSPSGGSPDQYAGQGAAATTSAFAAPAQQGSPFATQQMPVQQPEPAQQQQATEQPEPVQQQAPVQQAPVQQAPVQQAPVQQAPVQQAPDQQAPDQQAPDQPAPVQQQAPQQQTAAPVGRAKSVVTVAGRSDYHRPDCQLVQGQEQDSLSRVAAIRRGYFACSSCKP